MESIQNYVQNVCTFVLILDMRFKNPVKISVKRFTWGQKPTKMTPTYCIRPSLFRHLTKWLDSKLRILAILFLPERKNAESHQKKNIILCCLCQKPKFNYGSKCLFMNKSYLQLQKYLNSKHFLPINLWSEWQRFNVLFVCPKGASLMVMQRSWGGWYRNFHSCK